VDSQGSVLFVYVSAADINNRTALRAMLPILKGTYAKVTKIWADMGYQSQQLKQELAQCCIELDIVKRPRRGFYIPAGVEDVVTYLKERGIALYEGFKVLPKRWIVERTFACRAEYWCLSYLFMNNFNFQMR
jgi:transposase